MTIQNCTNTRRQRKTEGGREEDMLHTGRKKEVKMEKCEVGKQGRVKK